MASATIHLSLCCSGMASAAIQLWPVTWLVLTYNSLYCSDMPSATIQLTLSGYSNMASATIQLSLANDMASATTELSGQ